MCESTPMTHCIYSLRELHHIRTIFCVLTRIRCAVLGGACNLMFFRFRIHARKIKRARARACVCACVCECVCVCVKQPLRVSRVTCYDHEEKSGTQSSQSTTSASFYVLIIFHCFQDSPETPTSSHYSIQMAHYVNGQDKRLIMAI